MGVEVGTIGRKIEQIGAGRFDGAADCWPLVAAEVVHDDHIARRQLRHEHLVDISLEGIAVDRAVEDHRGRDPVEA